MALCVTMLTSKFGEIDTHIKSARYSVVEKNADEMKDTLQKTRRLMKASLNKSECILKETTKEFQSEMETLIKKNYETQKVLAETKQKLNTLTNDYAADVFTDSDKEEENVKEKTELTVVDKKGKQ